MRRRGHGRTRRGTKRRRRIRRRGERANNVSETFVVFISSPISLTHSTSAVTSSRSVAPRAAHWLNFELNLFFVRRTQWNVFVISKLILLATFFRFSATSPSFLLPLAPRRGEIQLSILVALGARSSANRNILMRNQDASDSNQHSYSNKLSFYDVVIHDSPTPPRSPNALHVPSALRRSPSTRFRRNFGSVYSGRDFSRRPLPSTYQMQQLSISA